MAWQSSHWLSTERVDNFFYMECDRKTMQDIREIDAIEETGGEITYNDLTALKVSGSLPFVGDFDIGNNYIRIYSTSRLGNDEITIRHATLMASTPQTDFSSAVGTGTIECYSLLNILDDTAIEEPLTIHSGTDAIGQATLLIAEAGLSFVADDSSMILSAPRSFDAGTSYLEICNDLMSIAGFDSLEIDASGTVRIERYVDPANQSPIWTLRDDVENVIFSPDVTYEFDTFSVPNKVIAVKSNAEDEEPLIAVAINDDPNSIYSTVSRGRVVVHVETVSDVEDLEALQAVADRTLSTKTSAVESVNVVHPFLPYNPGESLRLNYTKHGLDFIGAASSKELTLKRGMPCKTRLRRFVRR